MEYAAMAPFLRRQVGHSENENASGIVRRHVVVDVGTCRVLNFDAGYVLLNRVAPHDDVLRLPHVDPRIRRTFDAAILDQNVRAKYGIKPVSAVRLFGSAHPLDADVRQNELLGSLDLDAVAARVFHSQVAYGDILLARDQESLGAGPGPLVLESE